jgi:aldose 1-epimerase
MWNAAPIIGPTAAAVSLSLVSPDGDQGFPGTLTIRVVYSLTKANEFKIEYEATTDRITVVNLTNHMYFNLAGNGSGTIYGQELQVFADLFTPTDADLIPTGRLEPVAGTALDFRELRRIGARVASSEPQMLIARGYDHNFVLRKPAGDPLPLAARMFDPVSGRIMEVRTTEPGLQVYSSNFMTGALVSAAGTTIRQGDGLALETQHFPNSANIPGFPSTVLRAGGAMRSTTVFQFFTDDGHALH